MNSIVLITGATSGIGEACAKKFAAAKHDLIITGRRRERLDELKGHLETEYNIAVLPLCFDVQDKAAVFTAINNLSAEWQNIAILINNAGLALGRDSFEDADLNEWETMLKTNVHGLLYITKAVIPFMTLYAQLKNIELRYMYEESDNLVKVGNLPIQFDWAVGELYHDFLCEEEIRLGLDESNAIVTVLTVYDITTLLPTYVPEFITVDIVELSCS